MAEEIKQESSIPMSNTKFCKYCGQSIDIDCIICTKCGKQVEELKTDSLSQIYFEGAAKMAKGLYEQGFGKENEYSDYLQKLEDIWDKEMQKIQDTIS